jgi:hypothetical protein
VPDEVTTGELARRMDRLDRRVDDGFRQIGVQLANQPYVHEDVYDVDKAAIERRVGELEDRSKWVTRTFAAALMGVLLVQVLQLLFARGGL